MFAFNLDNDLKRRFLLATIEKHTKMGPMLNKLVSDWVDEVEKPKVSNIIPQTEEGRLKDWEWRKGQVEKGELSTNMAEEYPNVNVEGKAIYKTPTGMPRNGKTDEQLLAEKETETF